MNTIQQKLKKNVHFSSKTDDWATPQDLFDKLNAEFDFTLDPCATHLNTKVRTHYYTKEEDGLSKDWSGERVFCNPPYGRVIGDWVKKCATGGGFTFRYACPRQNRYKMVA